MYAMDREYWRHHLAEARETFEGMRVSPFPIDDVRRERFRICSNSGVGAIALADHWRVRRVILLGYDCQYAGGKPDGRRHWHADHGHGLGNAGSIATWPGQFYKLWQFLGRRVEIINASRETALRCFQRATLEDALGCSSRNNIAA